MWIFPSSWVLALSLALAPHTSHLVKLSQPNILHLCFPFFNKIVNHSQPVLLTSYPQEQQSFDTPWTDKPISFSGNGPLGNKDSRKGYFKTLDNHSLETNTACQTISFSRKHPSFDN